MVHNMLNARVVEPSNRLQINTSIGYVHYLSAECVYLKTVGWFYRPHLALCKVAMGFGSRERLFGHWVNSILIMYAQSMRMPK